MKIEFKKLLEGIGNAVFVKEEVEKVAKERIEICNGCEYYSPNVIATGAKVSRKDKFCTICGCNTYLKTRALSAQCPLGNSEYLPQGMNPIEWPKKQPKWLAVTDDNEGSEKLLEVPGLFEEITEYKKKLAINKIDEHGSD